MAYSDFTLESAGAAFGLTTAEADLFPDAAPADGLSGECDYLLALGPPVPPVKAPVVTLVEAKKADIDAGLGPCVAQMVAAGRFNAAAGRAAAPVVGCVTTGEAWQFLALAGAGVVFDRRRYFIPDVPGILGAFAAAVGRAVAADGA